MDADVTGRRAELEDGDSSNKQVPYAFSKCSEGHFNPPHKTHCGHDLHKKISDIVVTRCMSIAILKRDRASFLAESQRRSEALAKKLTLKEKDKVSCV